MFHVMIIPSEGSKPLPKPGPRGGDLKKPKLGIDPKKSMPVMSSYDPSVNKQFRFLMS